MRNLPNDIEELKKYIFELEDKLHEKQKQCAFYEASIDALPNPIFLKNAKGEFVYFNKQYQKYFHTDINKYLGKTVLELEFLPLEDRERYQREDMKLIETSQVMHYEMNFELLDRDAGHSLYWSTGFEVKENGEKGLVGEIVDISVQKRLQEKIKNNAQKLEKANKKIEKMVKEDSLTGLLNRRVLDEIILKINDLLKDDKAHVSILLADLDDFKHINDTYGHTIGDEVLVQFSGLLKAYNSKEDLVIRFGGEEFLIILFQAQEEQALYIGEHIRKITEHAVILPDGKSNTVSIGGTEISPGEMFYAALDRADHALYTAKNSGKNQVIFEKQERNI